MRIAAIDVGGTAVKSGLWDGKHLTDISERPTPKESGLLMQVMQEAVASLLPVDAIGVCTRGQVTREGAIRFDNGPIRGYTGTDVAGILNRRFSVPVCVDNDVNAAAVAEGRLGAGVGSEDFLCLTFGTCVGGAIVLDGKLWRGASDSAGEFGAMQLFSQGAPKDDPCGAYYENEASTTALVKAVRSIRPELTDGKAVCAHWDDAVLQKPIEDWVRKIAYGLSTLIHIFNPSLMVLGGGIMENDKVFQRVCDCTRAQLMPGFEVVRFRQAAMGNNAGMIGAALMTQEKL